MSLLVWIPWNVYHAYFHSTFYWPFDYEE